jgi:hypothetical protein
MGESQLHVFTWETGKTGNHLMQSYYTSPEQVWLQRFDDLQANPRSAPSACSYLNEGQSQIHVFARGQNSHLYQTFYDGKQWLGWFDLSDGPLASAPCAVQYLNNGQLQLHVFMQGQNNHLYQMYYGAQGWQGWFDFGGHLLGSPSATAYEQEAFQPKNVAISSTEANTSGDEPMIAVHDQRLLVSWNMNTDDGAARIAWSNDSGDTWNIGAAEAPAGFRVGSDSFVTSDPTGTYPFYISLIGGAVFAARSSNVSDWSRNHTGVQQVTNTSNGVDRPFISAYDDIVVVAWWDTTLLQILSARSEDGGGNWQAPLQVSHNTTSQGYRWGSIPIVASSSVVFVAWNDGRPASQSAPDGSIYIAQWDAQRGQFDEWPVDSRYNDVSPELAALLNVHLGPAFARNPITGELYLAWQDNRFTERNKGPYDIVFTRWMPGTNRQWSAPVRVSEVSGAFNHFPWLSCAPNGRLDLVFYSRRLDPHNRNNDVFYTFSNDGGTTWTRALRITEQSFNPYDQNGQYIGLGEYICCASDNQHAYIVWGDTRVPPGVSPSPVNAYVWFARATPGIAVRQPMP